MFPKSFDVFIAYHGSYESMGASTVAGQLYAFLKKRGLSAFFFPAIERDLYKANIIDVMKSKAFILVCNENIRTLENGRIDPSYHYELSTEIDAFYALTQLDGGVNVSDSKVLVCGDYNQKRLKGQETLLHELFANRTHYFLNNEAMEVTFEDLYKWIHRRNARHIDGNQWTKSQTTDEITEVFAKRSSMSQICNLPQMVASAKDIKCLGISNSELTRKLNPDALIYAVENGASVEILFLDPEGEFTGQREKEENLRPGKIKRITIDNIETALDIKDSLPDKFKDKIKLYKYNLLPRMNIVVIDSHIILQYYSNTVAGMSNPCFLIEKKPVSPLFDFCMNTYDFIRGFSTEITDI